MRAANREGMCSLLEPKACQFVRPSCGICSNSGGSSYCAQQRSASERGRTAEANERLRLGCLPEDGRLDTRGGGRMAGCGPGLGCARWPGPSRSSCCLRVRNTSVFRQMTGEGSVTISKRVTHTRSGPRRRCLADGRATCPSGRRWSCARRFRSTGACPAPDRPPCPGNAAA